MIVEKDLSYRIVGCAQRVHSALGPGLPENVYHRALCHELMKAGIPFESEHEFEVVYDGHVCGKFRPDIFADNAVLVELKAVERLGEDHTSIAIAYLKASRQRLVLLINFGEPRLVVKRFIN